MKKCVKDERRAKRRRANRAVKRAKLRRHAVHKLTGGLL